MKSAIYILTAILIFTSAASAQTTKTFKVNGSGKLIINSLYGDVVVTAGSKNEVKIVYEEEEDSFNKAVIKQDGNTININSTSLYNGDIKVSLPSSFNLEFNLRAGDFIVKNEITGSISGITGGGDVICSNVNGSTRVRTSGGDLRAGSVTGDAEFFSAGGDIKIGSVGGRAQVSTGGGNIVIENVGSDADVNTAGGNINVGEVRGNANVTTAGGNIKLGNVSGKVNASSSGGNIYLNSATGNVSANTASGNVTLLNVTGGVNVNTSSGRVEVHLNPASGTRSHITTTIGDINLYLPASAKTKVTAVVNYKGWRTGEDEGNNQIISDFSESSTTVDKDSRQVVSEFIINGSDSRISLNAMMGKIKILKEK